MQNYLSAFARIADYRGRSSRTEYLWFSGPILLVSTLLDIFQKSIADELIIAVVLVLLVHLPALLAQSVRRLHDADMSGWWVLISGIPYLTYMFDFVTFLKPPVDPNRFGPPLPEPPDGRLFGKGRDPGRYVFKNLPAKTSQGIGDRDPLAEIERLAALKTGGGLTDQEFERLKAAVLEKTGGAGSQVSGALA